MSKFAAFMANNTTQIPNKRVVVSSRFVDEAGKPIEFEIRALPATEYDDIQRRCMVNVPVPGQKNVYTREVDQLKLTATMLAACVVYPALDDAELQDSYGVRTAEDLLRTMLYTAEYNTLAEAVMELNKNETMGEMVQAAKN